MKRRHLLVAAVALLLVGGMIAARPGPIYAVAGGLPAHFFSPYINYVGAKLDLPQDAQDTGTKFFTLAFIINGGGSCEAAWDGTIPLAQETNLQPDITQLRQEGGDVTVSFGGENGIELAQMCPDVGALQAQYQAVIDKYNFTHIDFDIEGAAVADPASVTLRNKAIAGLESAAHQAGKALTVTYTLPVMPTGLTMDGVNLLKNALANGVTISYVNIMTMDYGGLAVADPTKMGQNAMSAVNSLKQQLHDVYGNGGTLPMIGVTPMIGMNDVSPEVFTLQDARDLEGQAQSLGVSELSMWSLRRDQPCPGGGMYVSPLCNGLSGTTNFAFSKIFSAFTGGGIVPPPVVRNTRHAQPNLLVNGDFETGNLNGWQCEEDDTIISTPVYKGRFALQMRASMTSFAQCSQTVHVQPGHAYTLQAYVSGSSAFMGTTVYGEVVRSAKTYKPLSMSFTTLPTASTVTVYLHSWYGQSLVHVDNVTLE